MLARNGYTLENFGTESQEIVKPASVFCWCVPLRYTAFSVYLKYAYRKRDELNVLYLFRYSAIKFFALVCVKNLTQLQSVLEFQGS